MNKIKLVSNVDGHPHPPQQTTLNRLHANRRHLTGLAIHSSVPTLDCLADNRLFGFLAKSSANKLQVNNFFLQQSKKKKYVRTINSLLILKEFPILCWIISIHTKFPLQSNVGSVPNTGFSY